MEPAIVYFEAAEYPPLLRETQRPPQRFYLRGTLPPVDALWIGIVGTRKATEAGKDLARQAARCFASQGAIVVSGLAMGIDTAAHEGALLGGGKTVAVLGTGVDIIYPAQNENLAGKILRSGAIISEYPAGTRGLQYRFLERNRIVAGLVHALLVIEVPARSGALQTARLAAESGRDVFVLSGEGPQYAGSRALIEDGAEATPSAEAMWTKVKASTLAHFSPQNANHYRSSRLTPKATIRPEPKQSRAKVFTQTQDLILRTLPAFQFPPSIDKIAEETKLTPRAVQQEISELILSDAVEEIGLGFRVKR